MFQSVAEFLSACRVAVLDNCDVPLVDLLAVSQGLGNGQCHFLKYLVMIPTIVTLCQGFCAAAEDVLQRTSSRTQRAWWRLSLAPDMEVCRAWPDVIIDHELELLGFCIPDICQGHFFFSSAPSYLVHAPCCSKLITLLFHSSSTPAHTSPTLSGICSYLVFCHSGVVG